MFDEDAVDESTYQESGAIDIQTALHRYPKLAIVGDPGSGKSTFLKYIALMLSRSHVSGNSALALEKLCLPEPLPLPIFLSCWDLADFLKRKEQARLPELVEFIADRLAAYDFPVSSHAVEQLLRSGGCCLLFDGLDEVPTDLGRSTVSRLLEDCVRHFGDNRYVVTSRVRAYTGDAILKGGFTRCDIQPFDADDRRDFVRNWVALLFSIPPEEVDREGSKARPEFEGLTEGVETNDRIRPLAVNPLLLTVIAIVHWNRKRLPEQRVDLYDECVDVLLGQRKEAERIQLSRSVEAMDVGIEGRTQEDRAWVRKRFAEIALHILCQDADSEEATKAELVKLLVPRFIDQGAGSQELASTRAEQFLDRQELKSGLLVSRRAHSYRFVHLTFQEYLAAWHLSNMDFAQVAEIVASRLRLAKWFEALQLLGSQWAKESDEKADTYVSWLLERRGFTINEQAPLVALCANIVRDIKGVAEIRPKTRNLFQTVLKDTLDAFEPASGVPAKTQVEILEALGQLGSAVKSHLIDATKASLFQVRRRAIEMLLPHLADNDLFSLEHILCDRSQEPVCKYVEALIERDGPRALDFFSKSKWSGGKFYEGSLLACERSKADVVRPFLTRIAVDSPFGWIRIRAMVILARRWEDCVTREFLVRRSNEDEDDFVRSRALYALADRDEWADGNMRELLVQCSVDDDGHWTRASALHFLGTRADWADDATRALLSRRVIEDPHPDPRSEALRLLARRKEWADQATLDLVRSRATEDINEGIRVQALKLLTARKEWADEATRDLLCHCALEDSDIETRWETLKLLAQRESWALARQEVITHLKLQIRDGKTPELRGWAACVAFGTHGKPSIEGASIADAKRRLFSRDADAQPPYRDPLEPVSKVHLKKVGRLAHPEALSDEELHQAVKEVNAELGWDIREGWNCPE
nr:NACHT domain-containing protein [Luteolibacter marinus]